MKKENKHINDYDVMKEEQNIKRRVYDALNVLIASGLLNKKGKKVLTNDESYKTGIYLLI